MDEATSGQNPAIPSEWMDKYPKDKTLVFY